MSEIELILKVEDLKLFTKFAIFFKFNYLILWHSSLKNKLFHYINLIKL